MKILLLAIIAITLTNAAINVPNCPYISNSILKTTCTSGSKNYNSTLLSNSTNNQNITIYLNVTITDPCDSDAISLVKISGKAPSDTSSTTIASIYYQVSTKEFRWSYGDQNGPLLITLDSMIGQQVTAALSLNLKLGKLNFAVWTPNKNNDIGSQSETNPAITNLLIDSNTSVMLCNVAGTGDVACTYSNIKVAYNFVDDAAALAVMDNSVLIGSYQFLEGVGNSSQSSVAGPLAQFGSNDAAYQPKWIFPGPGLEFGSTQQTVIMSGFNPSGVFPNLGFSLGISAWLKVSSTFAQTLFRVYPSSSGPNDNTQQINVGLASNLTVQASMPNLNFNSVSAFSTDTWTQLFVVMNDAASLEGTGDCSITVYIGNQFQGTASGRCLMSNSTNYTLVAGGFVGQIQDLLVFRSPAAFINTAPCTPTISMSIGNLNPEISLLRSTCPNNLLARSSVSACYNCSSNCTSCGDDGKCQTCIPGYYLNGSSLCTQCQTGKYAQTRASDVCSGDCATGCLSCLGSSSCQACQPGYALQGSQCSQCAAGTYSLSANSSSCSGSCSIRCSTCTSDSECQSCNPGYGLVGNECTRCDEGTYPTPTSCETCPSNCTVCSGASSCSSCKDGFILKDSQCVACPKGTFFDSGSCTDCPKTCGTCDSLSVCTSCKANYGLVNNSCVTCPAGFYATPTSCVEDKIDPEPQTQPESGSNEEATPAVDDSKSSNRVTQIMVTMVMIVIAAAFVYLMLKWQRTRKAKPRDEDSVDVKGQELSSVFVADGQKNGNPSSHNIL